MSLIEPLRTEVVLKSDYDALARDLAACKIARDGFTAASDTAQARIRELEAALGLLIRCYVNTLEGGRDRILELGGECDDLPTMEAGDPALRHAKRVLAGSPSRDPNLSIGSALSDGEKHD